MSNNTQPSEHYEDSERPGWCAVCRAAYPCPGSVGNPPPVTKQWPMPGGYTFEGQGGAR